jgi:uncharacterized protein
VSQQRFAPWLVGLVSGSIFALGLALSGMTDPGKVLAFLDVAGAWDPTLAFVMGGAVGTHLLWLRLVSRGTSERSQKPIDLRLVSGAAIFGVGWGMSGYCPGPALVAMAFGRLEALVFGGAMLGGVLLYQYGQKRERASSPVTTGNY